MADGAGGGIGKAVVDTVKDIGADLSVNLVKDFFDQLGGTPTAQNQQNNQQQGAPQMGNVQKNIKMASLSRQFQQMATQRKIASQQTQRQEQSRQQQMQEEKQLKKMHEDKKKESMMSKVGNFIRTAGKGEKRGQKLTG
jgi:hypothetical protein